MPSLSALISQPNSPDPPGVQGSSGTGQEAGLGNAMQQPGGGAAPGGAMVPPSHHETVAMLQHITAFDRRWRQILSNPEIGKTNVRGQVMDAFADLMADDYCTLPQVMGALKTLPTDPLEQKQWLEQHVANDQKAMATVLDHYGTSRPPAGSYEDEMAAAQQEPPASRSDLVNGVVGRYKAHPRKTTNVKGIPLRA